MVETAAHLGDHVSPRLSDKGLKLPAGTFVVQVGKRKFARVLLG